MSLTKRDAERCICSARCWLCGTLFTFSALSAPDLCPTCEDERNTCPYCQGESLGGVWHDQCARDNELDRHFREEL